MNRGELLSIIDTICLFFSDVFSYLKEKFIPKNHTSDMSQVSSEKEFSEIELAENEMDEVSLAKRTLMTKLYMLEQEIEIFKKDFPDEYNDFLGKIENLRETYNSSLEEIKSQMTFEIDPELSGKINSDINRLENSIRNFIETEVKFNIISKRLQKLIVKLNILYNASISHPDERDKVISQAERALITEMEIAQEFRECDYILSNNQLKDKLVTLISYADYEIFKIVLRNSSFTPEMVVKKLVLFVKFKAFDYIAAFKAFIEDELSDLGELASLISSEEYRIVFDKKIITLLKEFAYASDVKEKLFDTAFWNEFFELESSLLEFLKSYSFIEKDKIKVKIIARMNINVKESEVITLPKTNAYLALVSIFSVTHDDRIWLLIKLFKNVSSEITYKEIYFLLILFDAIDIVESIPNTLSRYMKKYITKYQYDSRSIIKKKIHVLESTAEKQYIKLFAMDEEAIRIINTLRDLKIDFKFTSDAIYVNSFYFNGLDQVFSNT